MATATGHLGEPLARPLDTARSEGVGAASHAPSAHAPVNILLIVIGVAWLIPTIGLLFTSLLPPDLIPRGAGGTPITNPGQMTLDNYTTSSPTRRSPARWSPPCGSRSATPSC